MTEREYRRWRVLRVDLTHRKTEAEEIGQEDLSLYMGGSGIAAKLLYEETTAATDPLGPENRLIFMAGAFTGSPVPLGCAGVNDASETIWASHDSEPR